MHLQSHAVKINVNLFGANSSHMFKIYLAIIYGPDSRCNVHKILLNQLVIGFSFALFHIQKSLKICFFLSVPFHHSPVPGNPTPPLTPNSSGGCVGLPFASPASEVGQNPMAGVDSKSGLTASQSKDNFELDFFIFTFAREINVDR